MSEEYLDDDVMDCDIACPTCGQSPTRSRDCGHLGCEDGYVDLYDEDPIYYQPGETETCSECRGTGVVVWCPNCGNDPRVLKRSMFM